MTASFSRRAAAKYFAGLALRCVLMLLPVLVAAPLGSQTDEAVYPHPESSFEFRVTNRRYISHIAYESNEFGNFVTIITTHPGIWAFRANSHALHYACETPQECMRVVRKLNDFLLTGWNIGLRLNGSQIKEIILLKQP